MAEQPAPDAADGRPRDPLPELGVVDWDLATAVAGRLMAPGPRLAPDEAAAVVSQLHALAEEAEGLVLAATRLEPVGVGHPVAVVDRREWVSGNVAGMAALSAPLLDAVARKKPGRTSLAVARRVAGVEVGALLSFLGTRVLGQYEIFGPRPRLSLVAPNIVAAERALEVDPRDFRMWVALHEQTHRVQFTAVPWLRPHLESLVAELAEHTDLDAKQLLERLRSAAGALRPGGGEKPGLVELLQTPAQRAVTDQVTAVMTLLEGHAEHVMDAAAVGGPGGPAVPSLEVIRARFDERRGGGSVVDRLLRRLTGMDVKLRQYRDGRRFVDAVVEAAGTTAFNTVWESPQTLPTRAELTDPRGWLRRVLGSAAPLPA